MTKLKMFAAAGVATLLATGAMATSAAAQPYRDQSYRDQGYRDQGDRDRGYGDHSYRDRGDTARRQTGRLTSSYIDSLEWRINNAAAERRISNGESRELLRDLRQVQGPMIFRVENGRASEWEVRRVSSVVSRIEAATQGYAGNRRNERYGYNR
jgi:hypothetical protein